MLSPVRRATLATVVAGVGLQGALFVSGIIAARILGPEDRGYFALLFVIPSVIAQLGGLGFSLAASYYIARDPDSAGNLIRRLWKYAAFQIALLSIVNALVLLLYARNQPERVEISVLVSLVSMPATLTLDYALAVLQGKRQFRQFNIARLVSNSSFSALLIPVFVFGAGSLVLLTLLNTITTVFAAVVASAWVFRSLRDPAISTSGDELPSPRTVASFGLRSYIGSLSPVESFRLDQLIVGLLLSPEALGVYVVGVSFTNLPGFLAQSVGMVAAPNMAHEHDPRKKRGLMLEFLGIGAITTLIGVLGLIFVVPLLIPLLFGARYGGAVSVAQILLIGAFAISMRRVMTDTLRGAGHPTAGALAEVLSLVSLVVAASILARPFGLNGVAIAYSSAAAVGCLSLALLTVRLFRRWGSADARFPDDQPRE
jgi:O-antigen/teichoic acid export membrane protein